MISATLKFLKIRRPGSIKKIPNVSELQSTLTFFGIKVSAEDNLKQIGELVYGSVTLETSANGQRVGRKNGPQSTKSTISGYKTKEQLERQQ